MRTMAAQLNRFAMILHRKTQRMKASGGKRTKYNPQNAQNSIDNEINSKEKNVGCSEITNQGMM